MHSGFFGRLTVAATAYAVAMLTTSVGLAENGSAAARAGSSAPAPGTDQHWGMLEHYCQKCHNSEDWAGGVAFDTMDPDSIAGDAETWEKAMVKLRGHLMPPPGQKQPDADTARSFVSW